MKTLPTLSVLYYLIELNVFLLPIFTEHASASISFVGWFASVTAASSDFYSQIINLCCNSENG